MKTKDIAKKYGIDQNFFEAFLKNGNLQYKEGLFGISVDDGDIENYVAKYRQTLTKVIEKDDKRKKCLSEMLISSGFSFDGYTITKYSGYISGDDATQIPRSGVFGGNNGENLTNALVKIRRQALIELKEAAYNLGCNAVIGVDFDYITLEPETVGFSRSTTVYEPYVICVTANGNAVVIEKKTEI